MFFLVQNETAFQPGGEIVGLIVGVVLLEFVGEECDEETDLGSNGIEKRQSLRTKYCPKNTKLFHKIKTKIFGEKIQ